jgi:CDP-6-deoxy-D-xylo-4-hexulose-3-dehydrase
MPVIVDIDPETLNIDPAKIEAAITPKIKAIMLVHIMGNPCDMDQIMAIAGKHELAVIEDCCEALGSTYKGKPIGSFGIVSSLASTIPIISRRSKGV